MIISYLIMCVLTYLAMVISYKHSVSTTKFNIFIDEITNDGALVAAFCIVFFIPPMGIIVTLMNLFEIFVNKYGKRIAEILKVKEDV